MALPATWAETMRRFGVLLARDEDAAEWLRQALRAAWGVDDVTELNRAARALALQRTIWVVLRLEERYRDSLVFTPDGGRRRVAEAFAERWGGVALDGPPWRLGPGELDRPTYDTWAATAADFN